MSEFDLNKPDVVGLTLRYPTIMRPSPLGRLTTSAIIVLLSGLVVFGIWWLEIDFHRVWSGIGKLGQFVVLMFPPAADGQALLYLKALGETLAIALLGTLLGAVFAFPVGVLAAANVIPNWIFRFGLRRSLDIVRSVDTLVWALIWSWAERPSVSALSPARK